MRLYRDRPSGTVKRARELRCNASPQEQNLLRGLREAFPRLKWRHQVPVGPFYADVLCFSERLVIEVDGDTHAGTADEDAARTAFLSRQGYRILRVANGDVTRNLEGVVASISFSPREKDRGCAARPYGKDQGKPNTAKGDAR